MIVNVEAAEEVGTRVAYWGTLIMDPGGFQGWCQSQTKTKRVSYKIEIRPIDFGTNRDCSLVILEDTSQSRIRR